MKFNPFYLDEPYADFCAWWWRYLPHLVGRQCPRLVKNFYWGCCVGADCSSWSVDPSLADRLRAELLDLALLDAHLKSWSRQQLFKCWCGFEQGFFLETMPEVSVEQQAIYGGWLQSPSGWLCGAHYLPELKRRGLWPVS